jgi:hypothetical protein
MIEDMWDEPASGHASPTRRDYPDGGRWAPLGRWLSNRGEHTGKISHQLRFRPLPDDTSPGLSLDGILRGLSDA